MSAVPTAPSRTGTHSRTPSSQPATIDLVEPATEPRAARRRRPLRVAMIGQRGVPASWGGIEHHVEALGALLVDRDVRVTVYARPGYADAPRHYRGMRVRMVPTIGTKHLEATVHSLLATLVATFSRADVVHYHALGPGMWSWIPRLLTRKQVVQTIHGRDDQRAKWGSLASWVLRLCAWLAVRVPHHTITVASELRTEMERPIRPVTHIPNGVRGLQARPPGALLHRLGLGGGDYLLYVGRFVPEKRADLLLDAFRALDRPDLKLVLAGASSFTDTYAAELAARAAADERVVLPGYVYGDELEELYSNACCFVQPSDLEGLPLTLLEATGLGLPTVASDIPPHREVLVDDAPGHRLFPAGDVDALRDALAAVVDACPDGERSGAASLSERVRRDYSWDAAADRTLQLYLTDARVPATAGTRGAA